MSPVIRNRFDNAFSRSSGRSGNAPEPDDRSTAIMAHSLSTPTLSGSLAIAAIVPVYILVH